MIVNVKLNNLVLLLTGRSNGFIYPLLNTNISVPYTTDKRVQAARKLLKLDVRGIDFFVYGALASIYASLYYVRSLDVEHQAAFVPGVIPMTHSGAEVYQRGANGDIVYVLDVPQPEVGSNAWSLLPYFDDTDISVIRNHINWDAPHDSIKLEYGDPDNLTITKYWLGVAGVATTVLLPPVGDIVQLDVFDFAGIRASFDTNGTSATFINAQPKIYPYALLRDRIMDDSAMISLMLDAGTLEAFHEATNPIEAVGALAAAIVRKAAAAAPSYEATLEDTLQEGIPDEMQFVVKFDAVEVPCNE